jgi:hypothetical protein
MMPMHDPEGLRRRERELREGAERTRQVRDARADDDEVSVLPEAPTASVTVLPEPVLDEACDACDVEQERTSA